MVSVVTSTTGSALAAHEAIPKRKVVAWAFWDWGTQPFATVITTFVFAVYLTSSAFGEENQTSIAMSISTGIAGLGIALLAPVLGQSSDRHGLRMASLKWATWAVAATSAALFFVKPDPAYLWLGLGLMGLGAIIAEIANVNYYALLDEIATPENVGKVSGFGWGMGYLGGIVMLLVIYFGFIQPEVGLFGVTSDQAMDIRVSMLLCGLWTLLFTIPLFVSIKDGPRPQSVSHRGLAEAYRALFRSIARLWRTSRHTVYFLLASALYRDGLAAVFIVGGIIAAGTFKLSPGDVIVFGAVANVVAGIATILIGYLDDKLGPKFVIMASLVSLIALGIVIFFFGRMAATGAMDDAGSRQAFWVLGLLMTIFVGPAQSASRSFLARLVPEGKAGELFGLYVTTGRAVSFFGPTMFGVAIVLGGWLTGSDKTQYWGILGVVVVLLLGALVMVPVKAPEPRDT